MEIIKTMKNNKHITSYLNSLGYNGFNVNENVFFWKEFKTSEGTELKLHKFSLLSSSNCVATIDVDDTRLCSQTNLSLFAAATCFSLLDCLRAFR